MAKKEEDVAWRDRKRHLGLPISFTIYKLKEDRLFVQEGFFTTKYEETLLYRIRDLSLRRTLWQKIFGVGTVVLKTADQTMPNLEIKSVKDSERVKTALSNIVENERNEKRVLGKEMFGTAGHHDVDIDGDGIPDHVDIDTSIL